MGIYGSVRSDFVTIRYISRYIRMEIIMGVRRMQDILGHIMDDPDYGVGVLDKMTVSEGVFVVSRLLPECLQTANDNRKGNDIRYFATAARMWRTHVIDKIKKAEHLWMAYSDSTGYPYYVDGKLVVLYDYTKSKQLEDRLNKARYSIALGVLDPQIFKAEVQHMYRNGYKTIIFTDGADVFFEADREEIYGYEEFFDDDYVMNPGLQSVMIDFFQEARKIVPMDDKRMTLLKTRQDKLFGVIVNSEFMVPCVKKESEEEIEISHPYIDMTEEVTKKEDGEEKVIAIPVFTDGFEMEKCYAGHKENMLYKYDELVSLVDELGASGIVINYGGIAYYADREALKHMVKQS